jgi:4-alpha-glucanotransferase
MNAPGTNAGSNWRWRFTWDHVNPGTGHLYRHMNGLYGRV